MTLSSATGTVQLNLEMLRPRHLSAAVSLSRRNHGKDSVFVCMRALEAAAVLFSEGFSGTAKPTNHKLARLLLPHDLPCFLCCTRPLLLCLVWLRKLPGLLPRGHGGVCGAPFPPAHHRPREPQGERPPPPPTCGFGLCTQSLRLVWKAGRPSWYSC